MALTVAGAMPTAHICALSLCPCHCRELMCLVHFSRLPAPSNSSHAPSLPSSLPPLNVSPPSFGTAFASSSSSPVNTRFSTATNATTQSQTSLLLPAEPDKAPSPTKAGGLRILRPQKSTSFEVSRPFNFTHHATASNMAMLNGADAKAKAKPVITVSAPPANAVEEDAEIFNTPRAAPQPPTPGKSREGRQQARKTLGFGFAHHAKKDDGEKKARRLSGSALGADATERASADDQPSTTPALTPMLPATMEFPIPPSRDAKGSTASRSSRQDLATPGVATGRSTSMASTAKTYRHVTTSDASDGELSHASTRSAPARPARPASLIIPNSGLNRPRSNSSQTVTKVPSSPSSIASGKSSLPASRLRSYRASRSPSPASPPPLTPLPSPPTSATFPHSSDAEGWSTDASTRLGGWSTDTSTRIGSLASRKSVTSGARVRAHTIVGSISKAPAAPPRSGGMSSGGEESDRARMRAIRPQISEPRSLHRNRAAEKGLQLDSALASELEDSSLLTARPPSQASRHSSQEASTPTRDDTPGQSIRSAHDTYVRILKEKHATEKAELLKRIERLEREARKRDQEIKGLRWIILNPSPGGGETAAASMSALDEQLKLGRLRSGSKSSEVSAASSSRSRTSSGLPSRTDHSVVNLNSPAESTEDGLVELQNQVSDLIAPWQTYTPRIEPAQGERSGSPSSVSSLRRSNTMPDGVGPTSKQAKRTSSPVLPRSSTGPGGLGFDIPSIPGSDASIAAGESSSVPSLTASSSTSSTPSTLDAIPEVACAPGEGDAAREKREKEERRASRALKRVSASSLMQAASNYASNLKLGMSPSIGQVLDREDRMDEVLKKLRAFGGGEH